MAWKGKSKIIQKTKDSILYESSKGKRYVRLTPSGKCKRYDREIKSGVNSRTKEPLNDVAVGYRMGYRAALGEQAKIYKSKNKK